jgi:cytochrome P450 family 110
LRTAILLSAKDENGAGMTDDEVHDELITLLFAGHETTASALSWLFYWIHHRSEIEDKLRSEISLLGNASDYQAINNLSYLNALIFETLRIYPVVIGAFARIPNQDIFIMGHKINKNDYLSISIYDLHHREDLYPNSKQFKPERFLEKTYSPYEYLPFGGGNRRCLGSALALLEMKLVTVTILNSFKLALTNNHSLYPVRRGITFTPPASFRMTVKNCVLGKSS